MTRSKLTTVQAIAAAAMMTVAAMAVGMTSGARAEVVARYQADRWVVEANASGGTFQNCTVSADYRRGAKVMFMLTHDGSWGIGVMNPAFNLNPGATGKVIYWVDDTLPRGGTARAVSDKMLLAPLADSRQLLSDISGGATMYFKVGNDTFQISLDGTNAALSALVGCARRYSMEARATR